VTVAQDFSLCLAGYWKGSPAAFSLRSEAQRTGRSTPRPSARYGLAGRTFWVSWAVL